VSPLTVWLKAAAESRLFCARLGLACVTPVGRLLANVVPLTGDLRWPLLRELGEGMTTDMIIGVQTEHRFLSNVEGDPLTVMGGLRRQRWL
jgi:hypothetical protein